MIFLFTKPKVHLDVFTYRKDTIESFPVQQAMEVIPEWWKKLPKEYYKLGEFFPSTTMKTCAGLINYYRRSIAMPMWSDVAIEVVAPEQYRWQFSDMVSLADIHQPHEYEGFFDAKDYGHLKLLSPWLFQTKSDIDWMFTQPIYNTKSFTDYATAQGILSFKKQNSTNVQLLISTKQRNIINIRSGTPFLYTPLTEKEVVIHRHLITKAEWEIKLSAANKTSFINKYAGLNRQAKCPYNNTVEHK